MMNHDHLISLSSLIMGLGGVITSKAMLAISMVETIESRQLLALDISCVAGIIGIVASLFAIWHYTKTTRK